MFIVKFNDGTTVEADSIEENMRTQQDGVSLPVLVIENSNMPLDFDIITYSNIFNEKALSKIEVYYEHALIKTYTGYQYLRYLTSRIVTNGKICLDYEFSKTI